MSELKAIRERAKGAETKTAPLGPDIDLSIFTSEAEKRGRLGALRELSPEVKEKALGAGIDAEEGTRAGSFFQMDNSVLFYLLSRGRPRGDEHLKRHLRNMTGSRITGGGL